MLSLFGYAVTDVDVLLALVCLFVLGFIIIVLILLANTHDADNPAEESLRELQAVYAEPYDDDSWLR